MTGQEKLPDGLECCFKALAKAVFSEEGTVYFHRTFISFDGSDRTRVITRYANTAMEKGGDIAVAARAVMIYPAIKWLLKAREIEAVIAALPEEAAQGDFCRLVGMQSMLVRLTGEKPEMRLQVRREFFERCQEFTDVVFKAVLESVYRKSTRKNMARPRLAMLLLGEDDGVAGQEEISTHTIKTYYLEIIEAVAAHSGEQIRTLMSGLMPDTGPKTAELAVLYHNTDLLLREYARIVRGYCADGQKLLGARENRYIEQRREQSVLVAEYVKKDRMQVDHIISIDLANRQPLYRWLVPKEGINSEKNLTAACEKCNLKKSNRGGWWIVRAKLGHGWYAAVWVLLILLIVGALTTILCGALTPQGVLAWLGMEITKLVLVMRRYVDSLLDVFLKSLREYHIL